jgi:hypothetical protein
MVAVQAAPQPPSSFRALPLTLAVLGIVVPLVGSTFTVWPLSVFWVILLATVVVAIQRARPTRSTRVFWGLVALPILFIAAWEGGWWLMPAVIAEVVIDARATRNGSRIGA